MDRSGVFVIIAGILLISSTSQVYLAKSLENIPICTIQGESFTSPVLGDNILTTGIVIADLDDTSKRGFFMQNENCDGSTASSDGIYVYLGERTNVVDVGDIVEVQGVVNEYYGLTEIISSPGLVSIISSGNLLPTAIQLYPPFNNESAPIYYEAREGMYVQSNHALAVGPTDADDRSWFVQADLGIARVFQDDEMGTGEIFCVDDGGIFEINPDVKVGDEVHNLIGALDYSFGKYCMQLVAQPDVVLSGTDTTHPNESDIAALNQFSAGTYNLWNLFDTRDDPAVDDTVLSPTEYQRRLEKRALAIHNGLLEPDLIGLQEAESLEVLQDLLARPEIIVDYDIVWENSLDQRGLDVGLFFNTNRFNLLSSETRQGCTALQDGLGPDGNQNVYQPVNQITCDQDGDGNFDGNRLFSRPPLIVNLEFCPEDCLITQNYSRRTISLPELWVIVNHWKSKTEDTSEIPYTLPRRLEESHFVASIAQEILTIDPVANIVILGDMNDFPDSIPLMDLVQSGFINLVNNVPKISRYSYNYQGISQVLDHILINSNSQIVSINVNPIHINSDYPYSYSNLSSSAYRSSDHEPLIAILSFVKRRYYFPLLMN